MKAFPVFRSLEVHEYGLYPGKSGLENELSIRFHKGLTLIVGANGLGKTTLITLLFRLLTGPYDIPQLGSGDELGFRRLAATSIPVAQRGLFAARVADRAADAVAQVVFDLGETTVRIRRRVDNLSLVSGEIGGVICESEADFQALISRTSGVGSFGDFILMLRYLVFYFEDRRQLVWDASAQRQLLRALFLPPDIAQRWTEMERSILQSDSRMRNFQAVVGREEKMLARSIAKTTDGGALRAELQALEALQEAAQQDLEDNERQIEPLDDLRQKARLRNMQAKQEREARFRALEHAKLTAIEARFPGRLETGKYMIAHLMTESECLVCGSHAPAAAQEFTRRLTVGHCVVCDSDLSKSQHIIEARDVADERVERASRHLDAADRELNASEKDRSEAESQFSQITSRIATLQSDIATRSARLAEIVEQLPPNEAALRAQRTELAGIRGRLESMKESLAAERSQFKSFVEECSSSLLQSAERIVDLFEGYAGAFLSERVSLTWTTHAAAVGQGGEAIPFPAFELSMTGSDFSSTIRRAGPDDVSESQREFIDLAFRMSLMNVAGNGASSLVVDTPESSLDAVFAKRAGDTLIRFGQGIGNTVIVTSNLIEGSLLQRLVSNISETSERGDRLVDLFEIAKPTAAVQAERSEYAALRQRLFGALT